jgi:hypothetical protein
MTEIKRKRAKLGDVIEIPVSQGYAYAHYTHHDRNLEHGALLALLPGIFAERPTDWQDVVTQQELYWFFLPLNPELRRGHVAIVANELIPESRQKFPLLRRAGWRDRDGTVLKWWLWDGEKSWKIDKLNPEQHHLSLASVWGFELLVLRIEEGWMPSDIKSA